MKQTVQHPRYPTQAKKTVNLTKVSNLDLSFNREESPTTNKPILRLLIISSHNMVYSYSTLINVLFIVHNRLTQFFSYTPNKVHTKILLVLKRR